MPQHDDTDLTRPGSSSGATTSGSGWLSGSGDISHGRFHPGVVFDGRYRIVGLLGRGGMGEVYRADDMRLGQPVALKFLPAQLAADPRRLTQFHNEVRTARQVAHPHVCRVYDIGEAEGLLYLTMEYVDGEDLAASIKRVGRFPEDRAVELARQICAGLAAAHDKGVVHRDLKPANIMLDGSGKVRLMDFGLAAIGQVEDIRVGTPAYMAPEQIEGREVTARSDIYALGLVLYELFTGRRAFTAATLADLVLQQASGDIATPTSIVKMLAPEIERTIMRCVDRDPARRPSSALLVSASLPGGDPLAAALAAGETPSPAMVAAAGGVGTAAMSTRAGALWLAVALGLMTLMGSAGSKINMLSQVPITKSRPVLADRALEFLASLGFKDPVVDTASGYRYDEEYLGWLQKQPSPGQWPPPSMERPAAVRFWFRTSPRVLVPLDDASSVSRSDPSLRSGMTLVELDTQGRLVGLRAVPVPMVGQIAPAPWAALFAAAGLDQSRFNETTPGWPPTAFADERRAWTGTFPELPEKPIVVEAAAYQGRPVMFTLTAPWTIPPDRSDSARTTAEVGGFISIIVLGLAAYIARRHWKAGRVDRQAATRLAIAFFACDLAIWLIRPHVHSLGSEAARFGAVLGSALLGGAMVFLVYLGLEPIVRRLWPRALVTWSRLVTGQFRDPLVGRDMLVGVVLGLATSALLRVPHYGWLPGRIPSPEQGNLAALSGWTDVIADLGSGVLAASLLAMIAMLALTLVRWVVRRDWVLIAGVAGLVLVGVGVAAVTGRQTWTGWQVLRVTLGLAVISSVVAGIVTSIIRGGLFLSAVMFYVVGVAAQFPLLLDSRQPAAPASWLTAALILAIAVVGFRLGVRPLAASPYR